MTISMYQASVPVFVRALTNLRAVLQKGEAFAGEKGFAPDVLVQTRLIADMLPLVRQVQIATDMVKNGACRLAGIDPPKFEDDETTYAQLYAHRPGDRGDPGHRCRAARRQRNARDHAADGERRNEIRRPVLPAGFRDPQSVFPLHHELRDPARGGRVDRQDGFHGRAALNRDAQCARCG
jgi:hypothetical protein